MIARLAGVTYTYPGSDTPALRDIDLDVPEGVFGLVAGASAGGKSTFLRLFNGLVPQFYGGKLAGNTTVCGLDASRTPARRMATLAGLVFQEPEAQSVVDVVEEEIAFGMEQHGVAPAEMERRLVRLFAELGIEHLRYRQLATLSGGERQRVAIAAVLALEPRLLLLDEPTSQLDPAGSTAVLDAVSALNRAGGLTVLAAEHRLQSLLPIVDTVYEVEHGAVRAMAPRDAAATLRSVPAVCELARRAGLDPMPITVAEALPRLGHLRPLPRPSLPAPGDELIAIRGVSAAYGEVPALRDVSLTLRQGEVVALVGPNGSGKSTLFRLLAGLTAPVAGEIAFRGARPPAAVRDRTATAALVPQDPAIALYHESVSEEIGDTLAARRVRGDVGAELERWGLTELASRNPRDLSVGQQQRVAIGAMLAHQPPVWLLDEPTRGADGEARVWLAARIREHAASGGAAVVATHDVESAAAWATRVVGLRDGRVEFDLPARGAFSAGGPLPTQVSRLVPGALTVEEVAM